MVTEVATLTGGVKPPPKKKKPKQETGVGLQQFHTCPSTPPPPLWGGRVSVFIALPLGDGASVCQQSECGEERSVTHRQTVQCVSGSQDLHAATGIFSDSRSG